MTLQASGAISLAQIAAEFGGAAPHSLNEYYRGGAYVTNIFAANNPGIKASAPASLSNYYSTTKGNVLDWYSSSSWYCPPGIYQIYVKIWGAGGGGSNGWYARGLGGAAGGETAWTVLNVSPGTTYSIAVGAGGAGTPYQGRQVPGGTGGTSAFHNLLSAAGGAGGGYEYYHGGWGTAGQASSIGAGGAPVPPNINDPAGTGVGGLGAGGGGGFGSPASSGGNGGGGRVYIYW